MQRKRDVLDDVHRIEQRRVLKHHAELAAHLAHLDVVERHDVHAVDPDLTGVGLQQPHQVLHQHRLPLPRAADDDVRLAALDVEIDAAQDVLRSECLVQPAHADLPALVPLRDDRRPPDPPAGAAEGDDDREAGSRVGPEDVKTSIRK